MFFNSIRTKIIGGYVVFVLFILSFLAVNYLLVTSTVTKTESVYKSGEWIRNEMEAENTFWRQVIAMTDFFLTGEEEYVTEFYDYQHVLSGQIAALESSTKAEPEKVVLRQLKDRFATYSTQFEKAKALYREGRVEEAKQMDVEVFDPIEVEVENAWEHLLELRNNDIARTLNQIRAYRKYSQLVPSLGTMIDGAEAIHSDNEALQHSLDAEENFLMQVIALTDLFTFNRTGHIAKFHQYGTGFRKEIHLGKSFIATDEEQRLSRQISDKHILFTNSFNEAVGVYQSGDHVQAVQVEKDKVDPAEAELEESLKQYYPLKQNDTKRSLEIVQLVDNTSLSITRSLAVYVSFTLLIGLAVGAVVAFRITGPTKQLAYATDRIANGDFSVRSEVRSKDEIGQLARSFNSMAAKLQHTTVSKNYVDGIIKSMDDSLVVASSGGLILTVNAATCRMLGYDESELTGQPLTMLFAADANGPKNAESGHHDHLKNAESVYLTKNGKRIPIVFSHTSMALDSGDVGTISVVKDITELRRAVESVRISEHKLSLHIQQTPLAVIEWSLSGEVIAWNPAAETMFGYKQREMVGSQIAAQLVPESDKKRALQEWKDLLAKKIGRHVTCENLTKDGRTIICEWYNTPLDSEGRVIGVVSMVQDVTRRTEIETELKVMRDVALESARLKSEFLANMSHEIRTPMNGVIGMTGLLLDTELSADQRDFAETISSSGESLLTIINDILDFSKIEAGKLQFETLDFNLSNAVEGAVELMAERAHSLKIELASLIQSDVPTELCGDPGRLRQVLTNLIGNSLKFTEHGEVVVSAERKSETEQSTVIRFTVTDTGIGISEIAQGKLFQAFTQADGSTTRKYGGTGLGLAISKQLVELMGGEIGVESELGKGSTFWFTAEFGKQPKAKSKAHATLVSLANLRVLIVDDNATNRKILTHQLSSWGMIHEEVDSGSRALRMMQEATSRGEGYDLAILDLMMPEMDGFELARAIKSDPTLASIPLVLLTSFGQRGHGATALEAGIAAYLAKPVRQSHLFDCLTTVMSVQSVSQNTVLLPAGTKSRLLTKHVLKEKMKVSNKLILLAEDNIVNQKVAVRQLRNLGYRADVVANGQEALNALAMIPYDLVLMDCQMPEMDGYAATAEIRRREGLDKHTPIIAMTAHALDGDRAKCIAAGMDDYISKPVNQDNLGVLIGNLLSLAFDWTLVGEPTLSRDAIPPVDLERLFLAMGNDSDELNEILDVYLDQMTISLKKLETAVETRNADDIDMIAHNCRGVSANCGMTAVIEPLRELERMGREHRLEGVEELSAMVNKEFDRVKLFLTENLVPVSA